MAAQEPALEPELYFIDADGKKSDAGLHDAMLNNPEADLLFAQEVIALAIARGMSPADAQRFYGVG